MSTSGGGQITNVLELAPVSGTIEVVRQTTSSSGWSGRGESVDWLRLRKKTFWNEFTDGDVVQRTAEVGLIVVGRPGGPRTWTTVNRLLSGKFDGEGDASVAVAAEQSDDGHVDVLVSITDDAPVRSTASAPGRIEEREHVELWWCEGGTDCSATPNAIRRLGISLGGSGPATPQWIGVAPTNQPLPEVSHHRDGVIRVKFELADLAPGAPQDEWDAPFTVVFVDRDRQNDDEPTMVATSDIGIGATKMVFGQLVRYPGYHRFPTTSKGVRSAHVVRDVRKLESSRDGRRIRGQVGGG